MGSHLTVDVLYNEIEHYMGIHFQSGDTKRELVSIAMRSGESVTRSYHQILKLWLKAGIPVDEKIEMFLAALNPSISTPLLGSVFTEFKLLLDAAKRVEDRNIATSYRFPRPDKSASSKSAGSEATPSVAQVSFF